MAANLRLRRDQGVGIELRRGRFEVSVDGRVVGSIEPHETLEVAVEPGSHTLDLHKGRYRSRTLPFSAAEGEALEFRCHGAKLWVTWLASLAVPRLAISLRPG